MNEITQDVIVTIRHGDEETTVKGEFVLCIVQQAGYADERVNASVLFTGGARLGQTISCLATGVTTFLKDVTKKQAAKSLIEPGTDAYERCLNGVFNAFQEVFEKQRAEHVSDAASILVLKRAFDGFRNAVGKIFPSTTGGDVEDE